MFFDACVHLIDIFQETEGTGALLKKMDVSGVTKAAVCGTPVTKKWDITEKGQPRGAFQDTGRIYFFTATDEMLADELSGHSEPEEVSMKLVPLACGFNPTDLFASKHLKRILNKFPNFWGGVGELFMRYSEISMLTNEEVTRANHTALDECYLLCAEKGIPVVMHNNAGNESVKPYAGGYEYMHEVAEILEKHRELKVLLNGCGMFERGTWNDPKYDEEMEMMLVKYPNLTFGITYWNLVGCTNALTNDKLYKVVEQYPNRFVLSTDASGTFGDYETKVKTLKDFVAPLNPEAREKVLCTNAELLYSKLSA
mmetsp:Transcript_35730/g.43122  ORF Transcript_35730/g.43122 Transcript_35730/m.43122 type:complete len:312 (+) Transcript_35730:109-1044(+)|eukprot:CAMPEP_0197850092 /NCGR_PEP_ID=MMETSP1438-20131217/14205_1 /TAXON_ID=1461541 /ORGANISM="Pterosperma sp., Strain CCMP1384" /LENGTH=311 /DNA_ID=CAMNT_0043463063 /DNA_START=109 /DNA_END=1044 /DNA_ORIENTATION=+